MKTAVILLIFVGLLLPSALVFGDLTFEDVQKIRDTLKPEFDAINKRFDDVNQRFNVVWMFLLAVLAAVIGMPLYRDRKKERNRTPGRERMKTIVLLILVGLLLPSALVFGDLTFEDVQKIRDILKPEFDAINKRFDDVNQRLGDVNQRFNVVWMFLLAVLAAVIGMPLYRDRKKEREQDEKIEALTRIVEKQQAEIEQQKAQISSQRAELNSLKTHVDPPAAAPKHTTALSIESKEVNG